MLTHRGIKTNPDKSRTIVEMCHPQNIKEVQQLMRRLTALFRFVPRLAEKIKSMVQLLRKASNFSWDEKCEEIFQ